MVGGACDQRAAEADLVGAQQQRVKLEQHSAVLAQRNQTLESEARKRKSPREDWQQAETCPEPAIVGRCRQGRAGAAGEG